MATHLIRPIITLLSLLISATINAQAIFIAPADFKIHTSCSAYDSIKKANNPILLQIGKTYTSIGENKEEGATHAYIEIHGKKKWVKLECGSYVNGKPVPKNSRQASKNGQAGKKDHSACLMFFDNEANPIKTGKGFKDITPSAPTLNKFDREVLNLCGSPGKITTAEDFKSLMKSNTAVLKDLMEFTNGKVFQEKPKNVDIHNYLNDLSEAWYALHAFDHIFCGEKDGRSIGGLHFHGRYQQLERTNEICRMNNFGSNEVIEGTVYSMGVEMKLPNNETLRHSIKGYGLTLSAKDILLSATKVFSENHTSSNESKHCILRLNDGDAIYDMVFVRRSSGIRTYYPDATPEKNHQCKNEISLN